LKTFCQSRILSIAGLKKSPQRKLLLKARNRWRQSVADTEWTTNPKLNPSEEKQKKKTLVKETNGAQGKQNPSEEKQTKRRL